MFNKQENGYYIYLKYISNIKYILILNDFNSIILKYFNILIQKRKTMIYINEQKKNDKC